MTTEFTTIFQSFLALTPKRELASMEEEALEINMVFWLKEAVSRFRKLCRKDLKQVDYDLKVFYVELDNEEIQILARAMRIAFYESDVIGIDAQSSLVSRDYKEYSNSNAVRAGITVLEGLKEDLEGLMSRYNYDSEIEDWQTKWEVISNAPRK